jgi:hypothetical protein
VRWLLLAGAAGAADEEKDPGSAFGPKSIPLATGLVSVVYWVPGPFPGPTPVQPDERRSPFGATPSHEGGWMRAPSPRRSPNLTSLPVRLASPGAGLSSNLPLIPAMSTTKLTDALQSDNVQLR